MAQARRDTLQEIMIVREIQEIMIVREIQEIMIVREINDRRSLN